jgi:diguanylate cyclase (GGDEF)-like protein
MRRIASYDALTGLPNRVLLHDRLDRALGRARRGGATVAILFVDLDGFKRVNDDLGHETGDRILETIAERFSRCVRETDTISRYGGDEFVVLLADLADAAVATSVADKLIAALAAPLDDEGRVPEIGASVGIALYPANGEDPDQLLVAADRAMYAAKRQGRNKWRFATPKRSTATG